MILKPNLTRAEFKAIFGYDCKFVAMSKPAFDAYKRKRSKAQRDTQNEIVALSVKLKALQEMK